MTRRAQAPTLSRRHAVRLGSVGFAATLAADGRHSATAHVQPRLEANKAIARRVFEEGFNQRSQAAFSEVYAPDCVDYGAPTRRMPGPAGMPITREEFQTLFPDLVASVDGAIAEAHLVAASVTWRGTLPPVAVHVAGRTMHIFHIESDQIVGQWSAGWDWLAPNLRRPAPPGNPLVVSSPDR